MITFKIDEFTPNEFGAEPFPFGTPPHPYRFVIDEDTMVPIMEVYNYDDNGEEY
jgi:hypothetical protein